MDDNELARSVEGLKTLRDEKLKDYTLTFRQILPLVDGLNSAQKERYEEIDRSLVTMVENYNRSVKELEPLKQKCEQGVAIIEERREYLTQMFSLLNNDFKTLTQCTEGLQLLLTARVLDE
jgi:hypothetical protein